MSTRGVAIPDLSVFLIICMPTRGKVCIETVGATRSIRLPSLYINASRGPVHEVRNKLAAEAVRAGREMRKRPEFRSTSLFVLWVDDDQWFPDGTVETMVNQMRNDKEIGVLSPLSGPRAPWSEPHAKAIFVQDDCTPGNQLIECFNVSFQTTLMRFDVLERLGPNPFNFLVGMGEDTSCCARISALDKRMFLNPTIFSAHIDDEDFFIPRTPPMRFVNGRLEPVPGAYPDPLEDGAWRREDGSRVRGALRPYGEAFNKHLFTWPKDEAGNPWDAILRSVRVLSRPASLHKITIADASGELRAAQVDGNRGAVNLGAEGVRVTGDLTITIAAVSDEQYINTFYHLITRNEWVAEAKKHIAGDSAFQKYVVDDDLRLAHEPKVIVQFENLSGTDPVGYWQNGKWISGKMQAAV